MIDPAARKLTPTIKKQITSDWYEHFAHFTVYKPMWMLRRAGPIVIGVLLERDSSNNKYKPYFHIHILLRPNESITLSLYSQLKSKAGGGDWVTVRSHDKTYLDAIQRFRKEYFLPCAGVVSYIQVLTAYKEYKKRNSYNVLSENDYADMALLCAWGGQPRKGRKYLKRALRMMGDSCPWIDRDYGSVQAWGQYMKDQIKNPDALHKVVDQEIIKHKLENIPVSEFII